MRQVILSMIDELELVEAIMFLGMMIGGPVSLFLKGRDMIRTKVRILRHPTRGALYITTAIASAMLVITFFVFFGGAYFGHIRRAFGPWAYGILIACAICAAALPVCYVGWHLRTALRHRDLRSARFVVAASALCVIAAGLLYVFLTLPWLIGLGLAGLVVVAFVAGWFGGILVPDPG
jgi:hypothetical protein